MSIDLDLDEMLLLQTRIISKQRYLLGLAREWLLDFEGKSGPLAEGYPKRCEASAKHFRKMLDEIDEPTHVDSSKSGDLP